MSSDSKTVTAGKTSDKGIGSLGNRAIDYRDDPIDYSIPKLLRYPIPILPAETCDDSADTSIALFGKKPYLD